MNLTIVEYKNKRVLTTAQLAESYGTDTERVNRNFNRNKDRYKQNKHFHLLEGEELRSFRANSQIDLPHNLNKFYLWTEKGAWLHAKSLNTDEAWEAYEILVDDYYRVKEAQIDASKLSPELQMFKQIFDSVAATQIRQQEQDKRLSSIEKKKEDISEIVALNSTEWRKTVNNILNKIAKKLGGYDSYQQVRQESYELLEARARCRLSIRLTNLKREMLENEKPKSKVNKVTKMDVISHDNRLLEIYLAIVKEMAIKYQINPENL